MIGEFKGVEYEGSSDSGVSVGYDRAGSIERFRSAIRQAGGYQVVSRLSGVPKGTIENLLRGTDVRISAAYAIAAACKVSLDWLATGLGPETPEWYVAGMTAHATPDDARIPTDPRAIPTGQSHSQTLSTVREHQESIAPPASVHRGHLAQAIEIVKKLDGLKAFETPAVVTRIADAYDILIGVKP